MQSSVAHQRRPWRVWDSELLAALTLPVHSVYILDVHRWGFHEPSWTEWGRGMIWIFQKHTDPIETLQDPVFLTLPAVFSACLLSVKDFSQQWEHGKARKTVKGDQMIMYSWSKDKNLYFLPKGSRYYSGSYPILQTLKPSPGGQLNYRMSRLQPWQKLPRFRELTSRRWDYSGPATVD